MAPPCTGGDGIDQLLRSMLTETKEKLGTALAPMTAAVIDDPFILGLSRQQAEEHARQEASKARLSAIDRTLASSGDTEAVWREQVRLHRSADVKRAKEEAARAAAELAAAPPVQPDDTPKSAARRMWAEERRKKEASQVQSQANRHELEQNWLKSEWGPEFARNREVLRAERKAAEQQRGSEQRARAMECHRVASHSSAGKKDITNHEPTAFNVNASIGGAVEQLAAQIAAQEERTAPEALFPGAAAAARRAHELQDELQQMEEEYNERIWKQKCLDREWERQRQVSSTLEAARGLAESQKKAKKEQQPAMLEKELWEKLMAKNRVARRQESATRGTPRWGVFAD